MSHLVSHQKRANHHTVLAASRLAVLGGFARPRVIPATHFATFINSDKYCALQFLSACFFWSATLVQWKLTKKKWKDLYRSKKPTIRSLFCLHTLKAYTSSSCTTSISSSMKKIAWNGFIFRNRDSLNLAYSLAVSDAVYKTENLMNCEFLLQENSWPRFRFCRTARIDCWHCCARIGWIWKNLFFLFCQNFKHPVRKSWYFHYVHDVKPNRTERIAFPLHCQNFYLWDRKWLQLPTITGRWK